MTAPFQVDDVVQCWRDPDGWLPGEYARVGKIYRVEDCEMADDGVWTINLYGDPDYDPDTGYEAAAFRKIEAPNTEIAQAIRACRPTPAKVDAA